jgi:uncharacterized protein YyaL (SSP411 family)
MRKETYSMLDAMLASPTEPMSEKQRRHQLTRMWEGLIAMETSPEPTRDDWAVCSDAVNLMETLIEGGRVEDAGNLLADAISALAQAGKRSFEGKPIRLNGVGMQAVRGLLEDYAMVLESLPARTMIHCHRLTEQRLQKIMSGKPRPHDIKLTKEMK